ncbi:hypothetical protein FRC06_004071 [Ceratobasidium sp. 370]|nr:hypothetical protein FRC06_004071 [Ceratobasidium sp. 370]
MVPTSPVPSPSLAQASREPGDFLERLGIKPCPRECELELAKNHEDSPERRAWQMGFQAALDPKDKSPNRRRRHVKDSGTSLGRLRHGQPDTLSSAPRSDATKHGDEDLASRFMEATRFADPKQHATEHGALEANLEAGASTTNDEHPPEVYRAD